MSKEDWLDAILRKYNNVIDDADRAELLTMSRRQLGIVENMIAVTREDCCEVGCGECEWCSRKNREARRT